MRIPVTASLSVDQRDLSLRFHRAGGPGGQHVNKVETAVQLRFRVAGHSNLPETLQARLRHLAGRRLTDNDEILIEARRYRSQERNRQQALDRLFTLIRRAAVKPAPRVATRVPRAAHEKRLRQKKGRSQAKQLRGKPDSTE